MSQGTCPRTLSSSWRRGPPSPAARHRAKPYQAAASALRRRHAAPGTRPGSQTQVARGVGDAQQQPGDWQVDPPVLPAPGSPSAQPADGPAPGQPSQSTATGGSEPAAAPPASQRLRRVLSGEPFVRGFFQAREEQLEYEEEDPERGKLQAVQVWVALTCVVAALQWAPSLGALLGSLLERRLGPLLVALLVAVPDTPASWLLRLDAVGVLTQGVGRACLLSSALLYPGLLSLAFCSHGLLEAGERLERVRGPAEGAASLLLCALGATTTQLLLSSSRFTVAGPGVMVGMYVALALTAARSSEPMPLTTDTGLLYSAACLVLALQQPELGLYGVLGGAAGGATAAIWATPLARGLQLAVRLPITAARLALGTVLLVAQLALALAVRVVAATVTAVVDVVKGVRDM